MLATANAPLGSFACKENHRVATNGRINSGDGDRGPGWVDTYDALRRLRAQFGRDVTLCVDTSASVNNKWGLRAVVYLSGREAPIGVCGYGWAYPNGAKTFAAACYVALARAEGYASSVGRSIDTAEPDKVPVEERGA